MAMIAANVLMDPKVRSKLIKAGVIITSAGVLSVGGYYIYNWVKERMKRDLSLSQVLTAPEELVQEIQAGVSAEEAKLIVNQIVTERNGSVLTGQEAINKISKEAEAQRAKIVKMQQELAGHVTKRAGLESGVQQRKETIASWNSKIATLTQQETVQRNNISALRNAEEAVRTRYAAVSKQKTELYEAHLKLTKSFLSPKGMPNAVQMNPVWKSKNQVFDQQLAVIDREMQEAARNTSNATNRLLTITNEKAGSYQSMQTAVSQLDRYMGEQVTPVDDQISAYRTEIQTLMNVYATLTQERLI